MSLETVPEELATWRTVLLAPYLEQLRRASEGSTDLEVWEAAAVAAEAPVAWQGRVAEALAFRLCGEERLAAAAPGMLAEDLLVETAVGLAVQLDLKCEIDTRVASGQVREAKQMTALLHKLSQTIGALRSQLGEEAFARAERLAPSLADEETRARGRTKSARPQLVETEEPAPAQFKREIRRTSPVRAAATRPKASTRLRLLLGIFSGSLLAYMIFVFPKTSAELPPRLGPERFEHLQGVTAVRSRPPSLFVELDDARWAALARKERQELIDGIGAVAAGAGYRGAHVRTSAGGVVGEWMLSGGARLVESGD